MKQVDGVVIDTCRRGDIVIIEFPFSDVSEKKLRPAVVISNERYNGYANVLLAGIYGKKQPLSMRITNADLEKRRLRKVSYISMQNVFSAQKSLIKYIVDALTPRARDEILAEFIKCL